MYRIISLIAFLICFIILSYHLLRLIKLGLPKDYSKKAGNLKSAVSYSFIGAMNPMKKESAYLHFPTYSAGVIYHTGTFVSLLIYFFFIFNIDFSQSFRIVFISLLIISGICGTGIFLKRAALKKLRYLSSPDDYISNFLVTAFQVFSAAALITEYLTPYYFICTTLLFLYLPLGKLKHSLYFFAARFHLGYFYGWRGIWPVKNHEHAQ